MSAGFPIVVVVVVVVVGGGMGCVPALILRFFSKPPHPIKTDPPAPLKREAPFHKMISRKSTINNNLKSS